MGERTTSQRTLEALRVQELKQLCKEKGVSPVGKKSVLIDKLLLLGAAAASNNQAASLPSSHRALASTEPPPPSAALPRATGNLPSRSLACTICKLSYEPHRFKGIPIVEAFICPICRFRTMDPFNPILDGSDGILKFHLVQDANFKFDLDLPKLQQWRKKGGNIEVRMCRLDSTKAYQVWTTTFTMKTNAGREVCCIQPAEEGHKRRDVPHILSPDLKSGGNTLEVALTDDDCIQKYALAVVRTLGRTPQELCDLVRQASEAECMQLTKQLLAASGAADDGVQCLSSNRVKLLCPITMGRIETPARGCRCRHVQCFDLQAYVHANHRMRAFNNRWSCPVCSLVLKPPDDLYIDQYFAKIMAKTDEEAEAVILDPDGTWRVISDDPNPASTGAAQATRNNDSNSVTPASSEVVLDIDDSPAPPPKKKARRLVVAGSSKPDTNGASSRDTNGAGSHKHQASSAKKDAPAQAFSHPLDVAKNLQIEILSD